MSRVMGKSYEVYQISKELNEANIPKYKNDTRDTNWKVIEETPEQIEMYLPDCAIEFLAKKKVKILKTPFLKFTLTQIPDDDKEDRFIKFPSLFPKQEFRRELMFYMGMLLASYNQDKDAETYNIPMEYEDTLPLLLEYLYMKEEGIEDQFSIKHLNQLKKFNKTYPSMYDSYKDFQVLEKGADFVYLDDRKRENFENLCEEREQEISSLTKDSVVQLSSFEGALSLIDQTTTVSDFKELIEELMLNKTQNRGDILASRDISSFGYKRLRKELDTYRR